MSKSILGVMAVAMALALSTMATAIASSTMLAPFTQEELDNNWEQARRFPTGGVESVAAFDREDVAQLGIDSDETAGGGFNRTEGIKTVDVQDFGSSVQVDLYLDPAWENNAVRAGLWIAGAEDGERNGWFGIIDFINTDSCDVCTSHPDNAPDEVFEGFRIWDTTLGWTEYLDTEFEYGTWVTLTITLDTDDNELHYTIDGEDVGTAGAGGAEVIGEVFLHSYNYGNDTFETLSSDSYAAHWHAGVEELENGDVTIVFAKSWTGDEFEGSDDVGVTFTVDIDGDEVTLDDGEASDPFDAEGDWGIISENVTGFPDDLCSYTMTAGSATVDDDGHLLTAVTNEVQCDAPEETSEETPTETPGETPTETTGETPGPEPAETSTETPELEPAGTPTETPEPEAEGIREVTPAEAVAARPDFTG